MRYWAVCQDRIDERGFIVGFIVELKDLRGTTPDSDTLTEIKKTFEEQWKEVQLLRTDDDVESTNLTHYLQDISLTDGTNRPQSGKE